MRLRTFTLSLLSALLSSVPLFAQLPTSGTAMLSGQQVSLPVITPATGSVDIDVTPLEDDQLQIVVTGSFQDLMTSIEPSIDGGANLRVEYAGRNGEVLLTLNPTIATDSLSGTFEEENNTFVVDAADYAGLDVGQVYVTIHTDAHPSGELRGIVVPENNEVYYANLFGLNEVPSVLTLASGALLTVLDDATNTLTVTGSYNNLSDTLLTSSGGAQLFIGVPGMNGTVTAPLVATKDRDSVGGVFIGIENTLVLTDAQKAAVKAGRVYVDVQTGAFPGGEIRGQLLPVADVIFRAHLSGNHEWPVVTTQASGQVLLHLVGSTVRVIGSFGNLSSPVVTALNGGVHLHPGLAGQNGPILLPLAFELDEDSLGGEFQLSETYQLTGDQRQTMLERGFYVNIHSMEHMTGELRGQVLPECRAVFTTFMNGNQHIPAVTSTGRGMLKTELRSNHITVTGSFTDLTSNLDYSIRGGAHLHVGYPGQNGPIVYPLTVDAPEQTRSGAIRAADNRFEIDVTRIDTLYDRFLYANIHSLDYPAGEIRGSLLAEAEGYFFAPLGGASQPEGIPTDATGMIAAEVDDAGMTVVGSFEGLDSEFAQNIRGGMHLHQALAGSDGPILFPLNTELDQDQLGGVLLADSNRLALNPTQLKALADRKLYANVHTRERPAGAIRGQLLPPATAYFHTTLSGFNEVDPVITTARGGLKLELSDSNLVVTGSATMLEGTFDFQPNGGAHLHLAPAGQNGGIVLPLTGDTILAGAAVEFIADSNRYVLADSLATALRSGQLYANIHTTAVRSGEVRGQIRSELNLFPDSSMIIRPMDGDSLRLEGSNQQEFRVDYMPSTDPDGDTVVYVWQLATDADFDTIVFAASTGRDTFFSTNFGTVDVLLDSAGIDTNVTATLYHRVLASDGSNFTPSMEATITLTRDSIVSNRNFLPVGFAGRTFPNPAMSDATLTYELTTQESFRGRLLLYNQLGQLRQDVVVNARPGTQQIALNSQDLTAGYYFLTLRHEDGRMIQVTRIAVR